jgi:hypothetical protein
VGGRADWRTGGCEDFPLARTLSCITYVGLLLNGTALRQQCFRRALDQLSERPGLMSGPEH